MNDFEIYKILSEKKNIYGVMTRSKLRKKYEEQNDGIYEDSISSSEYRLDNDIINDLLQCDKLLIEYEKINLKLDMLINNNIDSELINYIKKSIVKTLSLKNNLLSDELVINELLKYFDSLNQYINTISESYKLSASYINKSLNSSAIKEINNMSETMVSLSEEYSKLNDKLLK